MAGNTGTPLIAELPRSESIGGPAGFVDPEQFYEDIRSHAVRPGQLQKDLLMNDPRRPSYPVVHVTVHPTAAPTSTLPGTTGTTRPGDLQDTRGQVTAYAIAVAARLGRGVRMTTTDPDGEWKLGVYPDGEVVDLAPAPVKGRPATRTGIGQRRPGVHRYQARTGDRIDKRLD